MSGSRNTKGKQGFAVLDYILPPLLKGGAAVAAEGFENS